MLFLFFESREPSLRDPEAVPAVCRRLSWRILNAVRNLTRSPAPEGQKLLKQKARISGRGRSFPAVDVFRRSKKAG